MKLPEAIKEDSSKVEKFIDNYATEENVSYKKFLEELRHFVFQSDCPEGESGMNTYKYQSELPPSH
jgi:hypothetical protein